MSTSFNLFVRNLSDKEIAYNQLMSKPYPDSLYYPVLGTPKNNLPTPALLIDLTMLEYNLTVMSGFFNAHKAKLRPHFKTHKCPQIAHMQVKHGAIGMTCAKLSEAEVLAGAGITNILIANQVVDRVKIACLARLARQNQITVAVDDVSNLVNFGRAAIEMGSIINVVIEVDVGLHRSGVEPGNPALQLAREALTIDGIHFSGLLGYEGFAMFELERNIRAKKVQAAMKLLVATSELIQQAGIPVEMVSAGGTGTYDLTGEFPGITEIEAGSYVFMDTRYNQLGLAFKQSLILLATVTSSNHPGRCIIDAGLKSLSSENGMPEIITPKGLRLLNLNEEHGIVEMNPGQENPDVGSRLEVIPSHVCTTVNLHDRYYVIKEDLLVDIWEISGRGKSQ